MSEIMNADLSDGDDDIFIIKQIKPVNKLTLQETLIIKHRVLRSFLSRENKKKKKKKKEKKSNSDQKHKMKKDNSNKPFKARKAKENSNGFSSGSEIEVIEDVVKPGVGTIELKKSKKDSSTNEAPHAFETFQNEKVPESIDIESPVAKVAASEKSLAGFDVQTNLWGNNRKRAELSPENPMITKKFKDCTSPCKSINGNKCQNIKPLVEGFVDSPDVEPTEKEIPKCEISENIELFIKVEDDVKVNFEDFLSPFQLEDDFSQSLNCDFESKEDIMSLNGSELLCFSLKKIVQDEIKKQTELGKISFNNGRAVQKLFTEREYEIFKNFFSLENRTCKLFVRMLLRKRSWHRVSDISYEEIDDDLEKHFCSLNKINFIDTNIEDEDFTTQLDILKKLEVVRLCRGFNVGSRSQYLKSTKNNIIQSLVENCKKQKSVYDAFKTEGLTHREVLLKSELKKILGMCIKINDETFRAFQKILILFSFAHYYEEEEKRFRSELQMYIDVHKSIIKYPKYKLSPSIVFESRDDFNEYQTALNLLNDIEKAMTNKNYDEFTAVATKVKKKFENILRNHEYHGRFLNLPSFLKKFSAGTVYARILTKYCQSFKRRTDVSDIAETVKLLLDQNLFLQRRRGSWYETLLKTLDTKIGINQVAEIIVNSLKDPFINEVQRLSLQLRGQGILRKKNHKSIDVGVREVLNDLCTVTIEEPASIEIRGKALEGTDSGAKCVYVQNTSSGKKYISVEERAIMYYKSHGYTKGYHVEGYIIHSIYYILFFDIMYNLSPEGVFQSPYQELPLDFNSSLFYLNRKDEIDQLLAAMPSWDDKKVEDTITDVYSKHYNTVCAITWNEEFTPELFCEVIKCITMPILVLILQRLVQNFRVYQSGFPDLTLWNPETKKIKFVEVKSPNDRLSPNQRVWLNFLRNIGLNSEIHQARIVNEQDGFEAECHKVVRKKKSKCQKGCTILQDNYHDLYFKYMMSISLKLNTLHKFWL